MTRSCATRYVAALGGVVHFLWSAKADMSTPTVYGLILVLLLLLRFLPRRSARPRAAPAQALAPERA